MAKKKTYVLKKNEVFIYVENDGGYCQVFNSFDEMRHWISENASYPGNIYTARLVGHVKETPPPLEPTFDVEMLL